MDNIRHQVEASFTRSRDAIMEERYRRLHPEPNGPQYWAHSSPKAVALSRFKRHLAVIPRKKSKDSSKKSDHFDLSAYAKHYKDKYGSVSAHSTSAIYGALRAPHYHAVYGPTDMWYASVRSLNRACHRDVVYAAEAYEWRETLYEETTKEVYAIAPPVEMVPRPPCVCMLRRRPPHEGASSSHVKSRHSSRCKYCTGVLPANGPSNGMPSSKRPSLIPEKIKPTLVPEEKGDTKTELTSRMSGYKKCITGPRYKSPSYNKNIPTKESGLISRKSILECDVTAYDLIKKVAKAPSVSEIDDSDIDDNLSDNAIAKLNQSRRHQNKVTPVSSGSARQIANKILSSKFKKSQSENCIYSESHILVGGQRIFTDNHRSKSPDICVNRDPPEDMFDTDRDWRKISASDESICIPDPDYDFSDESDDSTVINSNCIDPKFTYSPPPVRKALNDSYSGLGYNSREISKSMSSLLSDDTFVPSINLRKTDHRSEETNIPDFDDCDDNVMDKIAQQNHSRYDSFEESLYDDTSASSSNAKLNFKQDSKYESSSDCSSSGGTLSSDYPTWTSSSSNELKSILKKKRRRENGIQEREDATRVLRDTDETKEAQKKKQVQFQSGCEQTVENNNGENQERGKSPESDSSSSEKENDVNSVIKFNAYEAIGEIANDKGYVNQALQIDDELAFNKGGAYTTINDSSVHDMSPVECSDDELSRNHSKRSSIKKSMDQVPPILNVAKKDSPPSPPSTLPPKLPPGRSSSLENVTGRSGENKDSLLEGKDQNNRRRRRATLPKRRFSDLHLHILLCPTRSICGNGSSSDDVPLTVATQRAHRSLPESPSELDEVHSFCFDFLEKGSKEKGLSSSRSVFYVPVDSVTQKDDAETEESKSSKSSKEETDTACEVAPSTAAKQNQTNSRDKQVDVLDLDGNFSPEQYDTDEDNLDNDYENLDPIYEELSEVSNVSKRITVESNQKSFFEGASKIDILSYLEDAKERGISEGLSEDEKAIIEEEDEEEKVLSGEEDLGEKDRVIANNNINHKEVLLKIEEDIEKEDSVELEKIVAEVSKSPRISEVERNDSGVGTETSKPPRMKQLLTDWEERLCADCDHPVDPVEEENSGLLFSPLVCRKCEFRRSERKEIIIEFVDTEIKYGRDLRIIKEEFYRPMEIAGLLAKDQLLSIFLNLDELTAANTKFSEKLQDALDIAMEHGDEDYTTVNIGKIFLETSSMLHAFETYCVKQASASVLLSNLEKEKELLRIFLRVSQMENTLLRRMNLPAFLMVPVQRVTRYPLLLSRLHKVTPIHHKDRNALKEAQQKVELHLEHINQQTKGVGGTKIWRRISNISASHRRLGKDIGSIKLRKMALEILNWKQDEARFVMAGKLLFTQITDYPWNKKGKTIKFTPLHALLIALGKPNSNYRPESMSSDNVVLFPRNTGIRDASLVLMKEKNGRFTVVREPLYLGNCVISCEPENDDVFEIQEYTTKEAYLLKGETKKETKEWLRQLRYHAKDLGTWRKRRNALANIMINGMIRQ